MKKLLFYFSFLTVTNLYSQQVLKNKIDTPTHTIIEYYHLANGNNGQTIMGNKFFSDFFERGSLQFYDPPFGFIEYRGIVGDVLPHTQQNICGTTFTTNFSDVSEKYDAQGYSVTNDNGYRFVPLPQYDFAGVYRHIQTGDINGDGYWDVFKLIFTLPKFLNNGNPVPTNLWVFTSVIYSNYFPADSVTAPDFGQVEWLRYDGSTWIDEPKNYNLPNFAPSYPFKYINCNILNLSNIKFENKLQIYPNPTKDFITIKNQKVENFTYTIFDILGKFILSGKSQFNEKIDIQTLEKGNYILHIQNEIGQQENLKFIKD